MNLVALEAASETLLDVSKERERQIVDAATSKEEGRAQLDAWRAKIDPVFAALDAALRAVFSASVLDNAPSEAKAAALTAKALALYKELKP